MPVYASIPKKPPSYEVALKLSYILQANHIQINTVPNRASKRFQIFLYCRTTKATGLTNFFCSGLSNTFRITYCCLQVQPSILFFIVF